MLQAANNNIMILVPLLMLLVGLLPVAATDRYIRRDHKRILFII